MGICKHCGEPLEDGMRADALYCRKKGCRSGAYRDRKKATESATKNTSKHTTSFTVSCACGNRLQVQVTQLGRCDQDGSSDVDPLLDSPSSEAAIDVASRSESQLFTQTSEPQALASVVRDVSVTHPTSIASSIFGNRKPADLPSPRVHHTYELFAINEVDGRAVPLLAAFPLHKQEGRTHMRLQIGDTATDGFGLAGAPGRWRDFYGERSPTDFGQDADRAVMYWELTERGGRGKALPIDWLTTYVGPDWRDKLFS